MKKGLVIAILLDILTLLALHAIGYDVNTFEAILIGLVFGLIGGMLTDE